MNNTKRLILEELYRVSVQHYSFTTACQQADRKHHTHVEPLHKISLNREL